MTPSEFFDGWSLTPPDDRRRDLGAELLGAPGGVQLAEAYLAIPSPRLRARVLALVGEIAGTDGVVRRAGRKVA